MSRYQQIRVRVEPYYKKGLDRDFPRLHRLLCGLQPELEQESPSLYHLAPLLVHLGQKTDLEPGVELALAHHGRTILSLRAQVEERISQWKLGEAEKLLNDLDDAFEALESELPA